MSRVGPLRVFQELQHLTFQRHLHLHTAHVSDACRACSGDYDHSPCPLRVFLALQDAAFWETCVQLCSFALHSGAMPAMCVQMRCGSCWASRQSWPAAGLPETPGHHLPKTPALWSVAGSTHCMCKVVCSCKSRQNLGRCSCVRSWPAEGPPETPGHHLLVTPARVSSDIK